MQERRKRLRALGLTALSVSNSAGSNYCSSEYEPCELEVKNPGIKGMVVGLWFIIESYHDTDKIAYNAFVILFAVSQNLP